MQNFNKVEDTLYIPLLGRIFASINFPDIFHDKKALEIKNKLPRNLRRQDNQTEYTLLTYATRSVNIDRYVANFINRNPNGIIVNLGCGLDTTYYRNDNGKIRWFEVDSAEVIKYRLEILGETSLDKYFIADVFKYEWIDKVRKIDDKAPILVIASGLFNYYSKENVLNLLRMLSNYGDIEI